MVDMITDLKRIANNITDIQSKIPEFIILTEFQRGELAGRKQQLKEIIEKLEET